MNDEYPKPLLPLSREQEEKVAQLTEEELKLIDQGLLSNASAQWSRMEK